MAGRVHERKLANDRADDFLVFLRLDAAGAVDQNATRLEKGNRCADDGKLLRWHSGKIFQRQPPAKINAAAHNTRVRTRRVDKDSVESALLEQASITGPIMADAVDNSGAQPL